MIEVQDIEEYTPNVQDIEQDMQDVGIKSLNVIAKRKGTVSSPWMCRKQEARENNAARLDVKKNITFLGVRILKLPRMSLNLHLSFLTDICIVDKGTVGPNFGRALESV